MKYNKKKVNYLINLIETDDYSIAELCKLAKIDVSTWYAWKNDHPEFYPQVEAAQDKRLEQIRVDARRSLVKTLNGYTFEESETIMVEKEVGEKVNPDGSITKLFAPRIKSKRTVTKHVPPNPTVVIFANKNLDAKNFGESPDDAVKVPIGVTVTIERAVASGYGNVPVARSEDDIDG